jgi:hypothetical protein
LTGHFIGRVFWDGMDAVAVGKFLFAGKIPARVSPPSDDLGAE